MFASAQKELENRKVSGPRYSRQITINGPNRLGREGVSVGGNFHGGLGSGKYWGRYDLKRDGRLTGSRAGGKGKHPTPNLSHRRKKKT